MSEHVILVENIADWKPHYPKLPVVEARAYLAGAAELNKSGVHVVNLCRSQRYLSEGYYCSLLAEARRHRVIPSVRTLQDLSRKSIYSLDTADLDKRVQKIFRKRRQDLTTTAFELDIFFGQCAVAEMQDFARQLFETFPAPMLRVEFRLAGQWRIASIKSLVFRSLDAVQEESFFAALDQHLARRWRKRRAPSTFRYDLAILQNPEEVLPPSDARALQKFIRAAREQGVNAELVERRDYARLAEYDALFIRETTQIDHYTYRFAKKADSEGMVVIDDPDSILKCTNKVYLAELLGNHKVGTPRTVIVSRDNVKALDAQLAYPIVLKIPDGSFSRGVFKAENPRELKDIATRLFKESDLILAQEFVYTEFDWRVGVLNREPLFVCQYFMSKKHWQIVNHGAKGRPAEGGFKAWAVEDAPAEVVKTALKAANLIGDGFYGVDVKETERGVMVIEVNDNPNLEAGVEDAVLKDELYRRLVGEFVRRLDARHGRRDAPPGG
ncbi:MAG TPA: ATP-grasp domain-containing protein [Thioalkalivibrio sp.]|nr:ATP-grasp domain-containing protein [Thioalkalivibrio sp.]